LIPSPGGEIARFKVVEKDDRIKRCFVDSEADGGGGGIGVAVVGDVGEGVRTGVAVGGGIDKRSVGIELQNSV